MGYTSLSSLRGFLFNGTVVGPDAFKATARLADALEYRAEGLDQIS